MKKTLSIVMLVLVALALLTSTVSATTATELKNYICSEQGINGSDLKISDADRVKVEKFFKNNEMTDEQATQIKGIIDEAIALMEEDGAIRPEDLSSRAKKEELLDYAQQAARILGFDYVEYDTAEGRLDIFKDGQLYESFAWGEIEESDGSTTITTEPAAIQTGSTNYVYVVLAGVMLIAGIMLVIARKKRLSAEAQ